MRMFRDPEVVAGLTLENPFPDSCGILHCGEALCSRSHSLPVHSHSGIELTYLVFGEVSWQVGGRVFRQSAGELNLINAERAHSTAPGLHPEFKALCAGLDLSALGSDGRALTRRLGGHDACDLGVAPEFETVLRGLMRQAMFPSAAGGRVARKFAELLVAMIDARLDELQLIQTGRAGRQKVYSLPVQKAVSHLNRHLDRQVPVIEAARMANLGESHFSALFRKEVGQAPGAYHRSARLEAARQALGMPESSLSHVAQEFGFSSSQHFSTLFRQAYGCAPGKWRKAPDKFPRAL